MQRGSRAHLLALAARRWKLFLGFPPVAAMFAFAAVKLLIAGRLADAAAVGVGALGMTVVVLIGAWQVRRDWLRGVDPLDGGV